MNDGHSHANHWFWLQPVLKAQFHLIQVALGLKLDFLYYKGGSLLTGAYHLVLGNNT